MSGHVWCWNDLISYERAFINNSVSNFRVPKECRGLWDILDNEELR